METSSCDRLADMVLSGALAVVSYQVTRLIFPIVGFDRALDKAFDLISKYGNWLFTIAALFGAWWLFWR